jgi:hypothetical protein
MENTSVAMSSAELDLRWEQQQEARKALRHAGRREHRRHFALVLVLIALTLAASTFLAKMINGGGSFRL